MTSSVFAGPWPRAEGTTFLSFSTTLSAPKQNLRRDQKYFNALYLERGLKRNLTFGIDAGMVREGTISGIAFLRLPVLQKSPKHRFAIQIGAGYTIEPAQKGEWMAQAGASWGIGHSTKWGDVWATLDAQMLFFQSQAAQARKLDLTVGLSPNSKTKLMMQMQSGQYPGSEPYVRLAPSIARLMGKNRYLELGLQVGVSGDDRLGVKAGTWMEF